MPPARGRRGRGARGKQTATRGTRSTQPASSTPKEDVSVEEKKEADESTETSDRKDETAESIEDVEMQVSREENEADQETSLDYSAASVAEGDNGTTKEEDDSQSQERMEESRDVDSIREDNGDQTSALEVGQSGTHAEKIDDTEDVVVIGEQNATDDVIIIDEDDSKVEQPAEEEIGKEMSSAPLWRVRMCPVPFEKFCNMDNLLKKMMTLCVSLEFRMSSLILHPKVKNADPKFQQGGDLPWQHENMTPSEAKHMGMLEMKVMDASLVELVHTARSQSTRLSQQHSVRFEIKRLSKKEALLTEQRKDMGQLDESQIGGDLPKQTEDSMSQDTHTVEDLQVNFALRPNISISGRNFTETDAEKNKEDSYLFVEKVPDEVPDNVLQAVFLTDLVERQKGENSTGTATFDAGSTREADKCLKLYSGVLINLEVLELSTARGTLQLQVLDDQDDNESTAVMDPEELKTKKTMKKMLNICKVEILKALPKSAILDTYDAARKSQETQQPKAKKATSEEGKTKIPKDEKLDTTKMEEMDDSEKEKAETSKEKETGTPEEANTDASDKKKTDTLAQKSMETSKQEAAGAEKSEQQEEQANKSGICFPQSLKVKAAMKAINQFLSQQKVPTSLQMIPHCVLPEGMAFHRDCDFSPYCDVSTEVLKEPSFSKKTTPRPVFMPWTMGLHLESKAREHISVASFQDLAVCSLSEIVQKDVLSAKDVTALKRIVDGLHQSTLAMGGSSLASVANLRLLRRDAYFSKNKDSDAKRLSLRASPFEHAEFFGGSQEKEEKSENESAEKESSKDGESEPKDPAKNTELSQSVPAVPQNDAQKVEGIADEMLVEEEASKADNKSGKKDNTYKASLEECRSEIARVLHALTVTETAGSEIVGKNDASEEQSQSSQDLKSHEILHIVKVINSFLSGPSFVFSSFIWANSLPLQSRCWSSIYATVNSFFDVRPPKNERMRSSFHAQLALPKRVSVQLEKSTRSLTAVACFMERATHVLKVILSKAELTKADVESLRLIVKAMALQTPLSIGEAVFAASCFQLSRRTSFARVMEGIPENVKFDLIKRPVGTYSVFGPKFHSICRKYKMQHRLNVPWSHETQGLKRPSLPRTAKAGAVIRRLQGAYRGVPRGGKLLHQPSRGAYQGSSRGATRARPRGGHFDSRRGGHPGQPRRDHPGVSGRGRNMSRHRRGNVDWAGSSRQGRPQSLLGEIPHGLGPGGPGHSIHTVHANLQAQVQAAQRELMFLQEQAMMTQAQLLQERELLDTYNQGAYRQVRRGPYQRQGRQDRYRESGRSNRPTAQQQYQKRWARKRNR